jgi:hypothetical protein
MTRAKRERTRQSYMPDELRVLLIGESPPAGGTFFYFGDSILHDATCDAFRHAIPALRREADFRDAFMRLGCYLEDLSHQPINQLDRPEREAARTASAPSLTRRVRTLSPSVIVIIGISEGSRSVRTVVTGALEKAGHGDVEQHVVPFPTSRPRRTDGKPYHQVYIDDLGDLVRRWRSRRVLLPLAGVAGNAIK